MIGSEHLISSSQQRAFVLVQEDGDGAVETSLDSKIAVVVRRNVSLDMVTMLGASNGGGK